MKRVIFGTILFAGLFLLGTMCSPPSHTEEHSHHLLDEIRQHQSPVEYEGLSYGTLDTSYLLSVHADLPEVEDFFTQKRVSEITSFPCANCHNQPLEAMKNAQKKDLKKAHWNIHMAHASENTMTCITCHAENNMNELTTLTGELIKLDESFKLCGQCHSTQYKDWQGGAHGKQINGWQTPRAVKTCVSCHNPHQPSFPSRFPARLNTNQLGE
ncbi:MAG: hypothetical protein MI974_33865 [Chitinophagales bacterium]|nr:hypothetical protein [Chitinophagales bacterium]